MEERYEIKGKIGQGGIGAVYRAHDIRMNREVAIKRIVANSEDKAISEEATRQLLKEAGSLASLQHPNIVTVYDVGNDHDGPFVVMELLDGNSLDALVEKAPLTWQDFRELALQTQEALIAAQELHIVHRDLKPANIMLTWLPSGKFQVKIVDFGLAKLSSTPSHQTIDQSDGVFGSIYFMAPEQFERVPIDLRADMYAIGCVYYFALTGIYPFDGDNAAEVMASHLQHRVTALQDVREGIPIWACDWIMWHLNRRPDDRPESARQSLQIFIENATQTSPPMSSGTPEPTPETPKRPRLLIPGSAPKPEVIPENPTPTQTLKTAGAPQPLTPPKGSKPSVHTTAQVIVHQDPSPDIDAPTTPEPETPPVEAPSAPPPPATAPLLARTAIKPMSHTPTQTRQPILPKKKAGISNGAKTAIAAILGIVIVLIGVILLEISGQNREARTFNEMMAIAGRSDVTEVPVDRLKLDILLRNAAGIGSNTERQTIYKALFLATPTDGTNVDATIAEFATTGIILADVRHTIIRDVLRKRKNPAIIPTLLAYARTAEEPRMAVAAIEATRFMTTDEHFNTFIEIIQTTENDQIRAAAEGNAIQIISKSPNTTTLATTVANAHDAAFNDRVRHTMLRIMSRIGGDSALEIIRKNLESAEPINIIAAVTALSTWSDNSAFPVLINFISTSQDLNLRTRAFNAAIKFLGDQETANQDDWELLHAQARTQEDQLTFIRGIVNATPSPWAYAMLQKFVDDEEFDRVADLADKGIHRLQDIERLQNTDQDPQSLTEPAEPEEQE